MLQKIGPRTQKVIGIVIFLPLIASFVFWGAGDVFKGRSNANYAATVGNHTITTRDLDYAYKQQINQLQRRGVNLPPETAKSMGIGNSVLKSMIERELMLQTAHDYGVKIPDEVIVSEMRQESAFKNKDGKFDRARFEQLMQNAGITEQQFTDGLRSDLSIRLMLDALQKNTVAPTALVRAMYAHDEERRSADIYFLPFKNVTDVPLPKIEQLQAFFDGQRSRYQRPEYRKVTVATLDSAQFKKGIAVPDAELHTYYDAHKAAYSVPEERKINYIMADDEATAHKIAERARSGEKLDAVGVELTNGKSKLQQMDWVKPGILPTELDKAVFKLAKAETSEPVKTPLGWYVVQIGQIKAGFVQPFAIVKDKIATQLRAERTTQQLPDVLSKIDDDIAGGASLEDIAKEQHLTLQSLPLLSKDGKTSDKTKSDIADLKLILDEAAKLHKGDTSNIVEGTNGNYIIARLDDVTVTAQPQLNEVKADVITDWQNQERHRIAEKKVRDFGNQLRAGTINKSAFLQNSTLTDIKRDAKESKQPENLVNAIFRADALKDVVTASTAEGEYLARVTAITPPDMNKLDQAEFATLQKTADQQLRQDYIGLYLAALEKKYSVEINDKAVNSLYHVSE